MLPLLWLAFTAPPLAYAPAPLPVLPPEVAQRLVDPPRCLSARCVRDEWRVDAMPSIPAGQLRVDGSTLPGAGGRLRMAAMRRDWIKPQGSNARVGMQYGVQAVSSAATSLKMVVDTGYRLQGYADDGIAGTGPILRGQLEWNQVLGERAKLSQTTRIETGQHGTYLRNSLLLNLKLQPDLTLSSGVETRRDSALMGRNQTDAKVNLRFVF